jgi:hypothetical protein
MTLPRRPSGVNGGELSHAVAPPQPGHARGRFRPQPNKGFEVLFRFYGPKKPLSSSTFRPFHQERETKRAHDAST